MILVEIELRAFLTAATLIGVSMRVLHQEACQSEIPHAPVFRNSRQQKEKELDISRLKVTRRVPVAREMLQYSRMACSRLDQRTGTPRRHTARQARPAT